MSRYIENVPGSDGPKSPDTRYKGKAVVRLHMRRLNPTAQSAIHLFRRSTVGLYTFWKPIPRQMPRRTASNCASVETTVRVTSYNVLSSKLCSPSYYCYSDPEHLDPENRLQKLLEFLEREVGKGTIFCLQEVSQEWAGTLHAWFQRHNYHVLISLYSSPFSGYMGSAICFPNSKYEAQIMDISRVSDLKEWPSPPKRTFLSKTILGALEGLQRGLRKVTRKKPAFDDRSYAKERSNRLLFSRLKCKETEGEFCIATYHMPCAFYAPKVMNIHAALAAQRVQELARTGSEDECEFIFCGDFNFKPGDTPYQLYLDGMIPVDHPSYPHLPFGDTWTPELMCSLRSAYLDFFGNEPEFTNFAQSVRNPEPFVGTLDYIFLSQKVKVVEMLELPKRAESGGPFPNENELSDHVRLQGVFTIPAKHATLSP